MAVFDAKKHCAYLYVRRRDNRIKILMHDGLKIWLATRRLNQVLFFGPGVRHGNLDNLDAEQLQAFVLGSPWQCVGYRRFLTVL